jgi:hypothetical protein
MNPILRLVSELSGLARTVDPDVFMRYVAVVASKPREILKAGKLTPADAAVRGTIAIRRGGRRFVLPLDEMDSLLPPGDSRTFSGVREMYARDVYLRNAPPKLHVDTVVDVGANRGMFGLLAVAGLGASVAALVEAQELYVPTWRIWRASNNLPDSAFRDFPRLCSDVDSERSVSLNTVFKTLPGQQCDLLKMDIEGGEAQVFRSHTEWLERTRYVTAELHNQMVDTSIVFSRLRGSGFQVQGYDNFGRQVGDAEANYLFAERISA